MPVVTRLYNPTPFPVDWEWHAGINIKIEPDGYFDLTNAQMVDFTPGQPGAEPVRNLMDELGIFIRNPDLSYESQALEAINACIRLKTQQLNDSMNTIRARRAEKGIVDNPDALEETFRQMGITALRERVDKLKVRARKFEKAVQEQGTAKASKPVDLSRTLIFTKPPKVFETAFAMQVFLDENPDMKAKYEAFMNAQKKDE